MEAPWRPQSMNVFVHSAKPPVRALVSLKNLRPLSLMLVVGGLAQAQTPSQGAFFRLVEQSRTAFTVQGDGARAMGTGGAFIAIADDSTAVSYNPAGLAQLLKAEGSLVVQGQSRDLAFTGATGQGPSSTTSFEDTRNQDRYIRPSFASFTIPWKRDGLNTVVLFSYQRLFDFTFNSSMNYLAKASGGSTTQAIAQGIHQSGGVDMYSMAIGAEVSPRILVGAAVNSWQGHWTFHSLSSLQTSGISESFDSNLSEESSFRGLNFNAGVIWRSDWVNLGAVYRSPFQATYTYVNKYTYVDTTSGLPKSEASPSTSTEVKWPGTLGWGIGLHLGSRVQVTTDWSETKWSKATYSGPNGSLDRSNWFDYQVNTITPDVRDIHGGSECILLDNETVVLPLRVGAFKEPQPTVDTRTLSQRVLRGWTVGLGLKFKQMTVDVAYRDAHDRRSASRYNTDAPVGGVSATAFGTETLAERRFSTSLIYQFEADKIRRALAWLLVGS